MNKDILPSPPRHDPQPQYAPQPIPLKVRLGDRSHTDRDVESLTWFCSRCNKEIPPRRGLIADYPVPCECGDEPDIEFDFSLGNVTINNQRPIIQANVKNQLEDDCTVVVSSTSMEITLTMRSILAGEEVEGKEVLIDMADLHKMYDDTLELPDFEKVNKWDEDTIAILAVIARIFGVTNELDGSTRHKLADFMRVKLSFYDIVRVLADGHPLPSGFTPGKKFEELKPGQIYKAPGKEKFIDGQHSQTGHAIVLIGAGRRRKTNYYHFINTWGMFFCMEKDGRYGFGMIRASDINMKPFKFIRYQEEVDFHKMLASTA